MGTLDSVILESRQCPFIGTFKIIKSKLVTLEYVGRVVGFIELYLCDSNKIHITLIYVSLAYRNKGITRRYLEALKGYTTEGIVLIVNSNNYPMQRLIESLGFENTLIIKDSMVYEFNY